MTALLVVMLSALLLSLAAAAPPPPTLCLDDGCRPFSDARVAPADAARRFVWISADGTRVVAGTLAAGAAVLPLSGDAGVVQRLAIATDDGGVARPQLALACAGDRWNFPLRETRKVALELVRPRGECSLGITATGYAAVADALGAEGTVFLRRLPKLSGAVVDSGTGVPVAGAEILLPTGEVVATTDDRGHFETFVEGAWPPWIKVDAPPRARKTVLVPKAAADVHLPVALSPGGSVLLTLEPPLGGEELQWEARLVVDEQTDEKVRTGKVPAGQTTFAIERLEPGPYRLILLGAHPLQRVVLPIRVIDGVSTEASARIEPGRLTLEVLRGGKPHPGAEVELLFDGGSWRAKVVVDDEGRAAHELWQRGDYLAAIGSWTDAREIDGDDVTWRLDVPERVLRGQVTDAATKKPVANAMITCESGGALRAARTAADGSYAFESVPHGTYTLTARGNGYQQLTTSGTLAEETASEVRDLALTPVSGRPLRALSAAGAPLAGALVFVSSRNGTRVAGVAGDDGRVTLPVGIDESGAAFVLPRSGSFGMARFASIAEAGDEELVVRVPDGTASLVVQTQSKDGAPIGGVSVVMRVNGILVPQVVKEAMHRHQGMPLASDAGGRLVLVRMPPGRYELWPLASREDLRAVASGAPPPAAVSVMLTPGEHLAKLVFEPKT